MESHLWAHRPDGTFFLAVPSLVPMFLVAPKGPSKCRGLLHSFPPKAGGSLRSKSTTRMNVPPKNGWFALGAFKTTKLPTRKDTFMS